MLTNLLKINQIFISILLVAIGASSLILLNVNHLQGNLELISFCIIFLQIVLMSIYNQNMTFLKQSLFALFYFILFNLFWSKNLDNISFYGSLFFLNIILYQILNNQDYSSKILNPFDIGMCGFFMFILHPPFFIFLAAILLHFIITGKTQIKHLILYIIGVFTASFLFIEIVYITGIESVLTKIQENLYISTLLWDNKYIFLFPIIIISGMALVDYLNHLNKQKTHKKIILTNTILILSAGILYLILYGNNTESILVTSLPLSILIANYSIYSNAIKREISAWLTLISLLLFEFSSKIQLPEILDMVTF